MIITSFKDCNFSVMSMIEQVASDSGVVSRLIITTVIIIIIIIIIIMTTVVA